MPLIKPDGLHAPLHRDDYDAIERVNFSTLKLMAKSPAHYRHGLITPPEDTDPKKLGRAVHLAALEPERFRTAIAVWEGGTRRGKDWDKFREQHPGCELLTENEYAKCIAIQNAVRNDARAMRYLSIGRGEVTLLWTLDGGAGVNAYRIHCKGRIDFDAQDAIVDLKTTRDGSQDGFGRQSYGLNYHTQACWYTDGYAHATGLRKPYVIVSVENEEPHVVTVYRVPDRYLAMGQEQYWQWLSTLAFCRENSRWPGYAETELDLEFPPWATGEDEDLVGEGLTSGGVALAGGD